MNLYIYHGLNNEKVPKDVTHVIVDTSVTVIKVKAFFERKHLVSVIMDDNVNRIEELAFYACIALRFIRLSRTLEYIGLGTFERCFSLEALFLPSTVKSIQDSAFYRCRSLRLLILPNDIDFSNVGMEIIRETAVYQSAVTAAGVEDELTYLDFVTFESNRLCNEWLFQHIMDEAPFHKLCYNSSITTEHINDYLNEHGNESALAIDTIHGMSPLHMLSMNPHTPADAIAALLNVKIEVALHMDIQGKVSMDYGREYNVGGLIALVNGLCNYRNAA